MTPNDPLYSQQWQFSLMGNIEKVWDDYDGSGVTVVVYDEGVQYTHPDLANNFDTTFFELNGVVYDPMPLTDNSGHGTSCAGLIGAEANNGIGGTGVAPGVTISAINYLDVIQFEPTEVYDPAMLWAANFDIMSNSWGYSGVYWGAENLANPTSAASHDIALWEQVVATGRDGLGTIIVKAAGNETHNVNGDGWNVSRYTITVAATEQDGTAAWYSNYGSAILVAGPASAVTTDMMGDAGYNNGTDGDPVDPNYTSEFNGTSAATPTVAGVIALMLDANDQLGWRDVQNILALSAHHTGSALGAAAGPTEVGTWQTMDGTNLWNGGGTEYHQSYGYGMVDAFAAVRYAEAWMAIYPGVSQTSANEVSATFDHAGAGVAIPDSDGVDGTGGALISVNSTSNISIEAVEITLTMTHANARDLKLWLVAPDGTQVEIYDGDARKGTFNGSGNTWVFEVDCLRGYNSSGTWSVLAEDTVSGGTGTLNDVQITFHGTTDTTGDVYNFTQDFQSLVAYEPDRATITDTNGGEDWLNFCSIEDAMTLSLAGNGVIKFDGVTVAHLQSGAAVFENAYTGDGNDTVTGNGLGNEIWGGRGEDSISGAGGKDSLVGYNDNDTLTGSGGADTLSGGKGADMLVGGAGNDKLYGDEGLDVFVFTAGGGKDTVYGFEHGADTLRIDDAIYGGGKTAQELVDTYAHVQGSNIVFSFGTVTITLAGYTDLATLASDIIIY